jgi:sodium/hydrogen antiporter
VNAGLAIVGLTLLLVAAVSRRLSSTPITPAMVVVAVGVLVGPLVLDGLAVPPTSSTVRTLAEATLAVVLFSDSSRVNLCVPLLLIVVAAVSGAGGESHPVRVLAEEIGYGLLGGLAAGGLAAAVVILAGGRHLIDDEWRQIIPLAAAVLAYGIANALGGSGFIAAFVAGALFGLLAGDKVAGMTRFTEETGAALDGVTFLVFGAVLLGPALEHMSWQIALYAVLSLTIVRMLPVAISLWGTHARAPTVAFMGWFGPRGLASIVFAVIVEDAHLPHAATIAAASYLTVGLSVLAHGLSAAPLVSRYATWYQAAADTSPPAMESQSAQEHRARGVLRLP